MENKAKRRIGPSLLVFACVLGILAFHTSYYRRFMVDDAFISLRYSERFSHGFGLTWNDGEVVEGYSNFLWVLGCAVLAWLGLDLVPAARVLGFLGSASAIAAVVWVYRGATLRKSLPGLAAGLAIALSGSIAIWTVGGLEQPLIAGLLAWVLAFTCSILEAPLPRLQRLAIPGLLLGLLVLTRADGAIFTLATCLGLVAARGLNRTTLRLAAGMAAIPALFLLTHLLFRRAYYHDWLPNSAYAKVSFTGERLISGYLYVGAGIYLTGLLVTSLFPFVVPPRDQTLRRRVRFLGAVLLLYLAYVVVIGGDFFPGRRHLVPAIVVLAFLTGAAFTEWIRQGQSARRIAWIGTLCLAAYGAGQFVDPKNILARHELWVSAAGEMPVLPGLREIVTIRGSHYLRGIARLRIASCPSFPRASPKWWSGSMVHPASAWVGRWCKDGSSSISPGGLVPCAMWNSTAICWASRTSSPASRRSLSHHDPHWAGCRRRPQTRTPRPGRGGGRHAERLEIPVALRRGESAGAAPSVVRPAQGPDAQNRPRVGAQGEPARALALHPRRLGRAPLEAVVSGRRTRA